jgi:ubiquinone/menaquinone biosynthesis C-methylase UbiE
MKLSPHASANRSHWNESSDDYQARHGDQLARNPRAWGVWAIPEDELCILGDVAGKDVLEFGCGAAQWSIALSQRGARCTGLDISEQQLQYARANMESAGVDFPLVHGSAEDVPLQDCSFDIVFCDHGAMTFADPLLTVPEAARLLRPGGLLVSRLPRHSTSSVGTTKAIRSRGRYSITTSRNAGPITARAFAFHYRTASGSSCSAGINSRLSPWSN